MLHTDTLAYHLNLAHSEQEIATKLSDLIEEILPEAINKCWHGHPVWFIEQNPIVGYSLQKKGIRLMFWSGSDFNEGVLEVKGAKFKDASVFYTNIHQIKEDDVIRCLLKSRDIQWDYKNIVKRKGVLVRLK